MRVTPRATSGSCLTRRAKISAVAAHATTAMMQKLQKRPRPWTRNPEVRVLIEPARPTSAPAVSRARLKRPVPAVRSLITSTVSTPMMAPVMHPDDGTGNAIKQLGHGENGVIGAQGQYRGARGFQPKTDQQQGASPPFFGVISDPRSEQGDHNLRDDDQARHRQRRLWLPCHRKLLANQRKH
jgi:hypothetical protein